MKKTVTHGQIMQEVWRLDTPIQTMVFAATGGAPACVYWGRALPASEDLRALAAMARRRPSGGMLDAVAPLSVVPGGEAFFGARGMEPGADWVQEHAEAKDGRLEIRLRAGGLRYALLAEADGETGMIILRARLEAGAEPLALRWLAAPVLPGPVQAREMLAFSGLWCGEFHEERVPWQRGGYLREGREGRTGHTDFPGLMMPLTGCSETHGAAYGLHLGWSGGHRMLAEDLPDGRRQVQLGALLGEDFEIAPGGSYETPPLYAAFSEAGLNGLSQAFHRHVRTRLLRFSAPERPVHYNCWEAVYFDHKPEELKDLATRAAALGVERFVLDDGWFGRRDDDTSSLGDWEVDPRKWPEGLGPLTRHVQGLGMSFGLWFEPEMINENSDLYRTHPDWVLGKGLTGRGQWVLDIARDEVADYLFGKIDALLAAHPISYIKWDHNRPLPHTDPGQVAALYALLARIRRAHPGVEIESCASGGGRIDFGVLAHTQRIWLSDSNDALERARIQRGASYFFPPEITGSHVGPRVCHTSGRVLPMAFRAGVAGSRAMGLEMDLRELTEGEAAELTAAIAEFKARRGVLHGGALYRLEAADPAVLAEMHVRGGAFVLFAAQVAASARQLARPLCLAGLEPGAIYEIRLETPGAAPAGLNRGAAEGFAAGVPIRLSGAALMGGGITLPNAFPNTFWQVTGEKL